MKGLIYKRVAKFIISFFKTKQLILQENPAKLIYIDQETLVVKQIELNEHSKIQMDGKNKFYIAAKEKVYHFKEL